MHLVANEVVLEGCVRLRLLAFPIGALLLELVEVGLLAIHVDHGGSLVAQIGVVRAIDIVLTVVRVADFRSCRHEILCASTRPV